MERSNEVKRSEIIEERGGLRRSRKGWKGAKTREQIE